MFKDKWTYRELYEYLKEFLDPEIDSKFDIFLSRNTRTLKEPHPYNKTANYMVYIKQF